MGDQYIYTLLPVYAVPGNAGRSVLCLLSVAHSTNRIYRQLQLPSVTGSQVSLIRSNNSYAQLIGLSCSLNMFQSGRKYWDRLTYRLSCEEERGSRARIPSHCGWHCCQLASTTTTNQLASQALPAASRVFHLLRSSLMIQTDSSYLSSHFFLVTQISLKRYIGR